MENLENGGSIVQGHKNRLRNEPLEKLKAEGKITHFSEEEVCELMETLAQKAKQNRIKQDIANTASFKAGFDSRKRILGSAA